VTASPTRRHSGSQLRQRSRLALAALAAGVGVVLGLAGCSAGLNAQTSQQAPPVPGANANIGNVALRNLVIQYNGPAGYAAGDDAPLVVRLFNDGMEPVTLTGVTADKADSVSLVGTPAVVTPTDSPTIAPTNTATAQPEETEGTPTATQTASPTPTVTPTRAAPRPVSITIPAQSFVLLVPGEGDAGHLELTGLTEAISPGEFATLTFTFDDGSSLVVQVPLAPPTNPVPRATPVVSPGEGEHAAG
jgi:copper(I)-binding protein